MISIHQNDFLGSLCSLPTMGISVIFWCILNFPLHFWLLGNSMGIFEFFVFAKLHVVQRGGINCMQFSHQACSRLFLSFFFSSNSYQPFLFFHSLSSFISSHSLTLSTKTFCLSLIPLQSDHHLLLHSQPLSQILSSPSMAPKFEKSSYIVSTNAFHLTNGNKVVRLTIALPLTYRLQQHLSKGARVGSVSFFKIFSFFEFSFDLSF